MSSRSNFQDKLLLRVTPYSVLLLDVPHFGRDRCVILYLFGYA
ncbi:hypothetical protein FBZ94_11070 [Bradyrhizobium sacchari]|uniref:Uncharacterized protein n=1 Tax=Bradyrhizobium sacchari TaxID=1399419 RepID=A0A560I2A0_9BRAD|nr:hypothetical protein FBZ94_11070 [Bradyrhizobium sacchari]TWB69474.1 hypothetical protein FBZ95_10970 [Bradyrhizobium sacchari]